MNVNLTLLIQVVIFVSFIMLIMQYAWPMFEKVLDERSAEIAKGLEDAERARHQLHQADEAVKELMKEARMNAKSITDEAKKHGLANQLRVPKVTVDVNVEIELE